MKEPTILIAGGGSLGHVTPALAVAEQIKKKVPQALIIFTIGKKPDEKKIIDDAGFESFPMRMPKFPRGLTLSLFTFPFSFLSGLLWSLKLIGTVRPDVLFCKGGFVSVPVALAAWFKKIPIVLHTSDAVPNLSDRILMKLARTICTGFPQENLSIPHMHTGNPVRSFIRTGSRDAGKRITGFSGNRPVLLVMGGSQGSLALNRGVMKNLDALLDRADIIHLTGRGKSVPSDHARHWVREEVFEDLPHLYALADIVLSRGGAGALSELSAAKKTVIATPLTGVAHDHQWKNTEYLVDAGAVYHLREDRLDDLPFVVDSLLHDPDMRDSMREALATCFPSDAAERVMEKVLDACETER